MASLYSLVCYFYIELFCAQFEGCAAVVGAVWAPRPVPVLKPAFMWHSARRWTMQGSHQLCGADLNVEVLW